MTMREIPITQFVRPKGEIRNLLCDVSDDVTPRVQLTSRSMAPTASTNWTP